DLDHRALPLLARTLARTGRRRPHRGGRRRAAGGAPPAGARRAQQPPPGPPAGPAAERLAAPAVQGRGHRILALAYTMLGRLDDAHTELSQALELATQAG